MNVLDHVVVPVLAHVGEAGGKDDVATLLVGEEQLLKLLMLVPSLCELQ